MNKSSPNPQPNALHIGFSKCASTFLQSFFEEHPSVFLVNQSHYLAPFEFSNYPEGKEAYLSLFREAREDQVALESDEHIIMPLFHPVLGAAATTLESVEEVANRIHSLAPEARIILVVRNQPGLLASRYSEYVICGGTRSFEEFVDEFLACSKDGENYFQNYYARILKILKARFGEDNVLILLQENLARNEDETIGEISEFLGVEFRRPEKRGAIVRRVGLSNLGIKVVRGMNRLIVLSPKQSFHEARVRIPFLLYKVIQRLLRMADYYMPKAIKGDKNALLTEDVRKRILDEFRADNVELGKLLRMDVSSLGY